MSTEPFSLHTYDSSSGHHVSIPRQFADIGLAWQADFTGGLYRASVSSHPAGPARRPTVLDRYPAMAYSRFTTGSPVGRLYEEHLYTYVPMLRRDYELSLLVAGAPGDLQRYRRLFGQIRRSIVFSSPSAAP